MPLDPNLGTALTKLGLSTVPGKGIEDIHPLAPVVGAPEGAFFARWSHVVTQEGAKVPDNGSEPAGVVKLAYDKPVYFTADTDSMLDSALVLLAPDIAFQKKVQQELAVRGFITTPEELAGINWSEISTTLPFNVVMTNLYNKMRHDRAVAQNQQIAGGA